mgnify:CR=1 FL=1
MKMKMTLSALLLTAAFAVTGAQAEDKKQLVFVVNGASDFWKLAEAGVRKAQKELPNYDLEFKYPEQAAAAVQQRLMNDLVAAGVSAIMVSAVDPKSSTEPLNEIGKQVPLFTTDSDAPATNRIAYIGSSNTDAGKQAGQIALKALPNGGKCIGFVGLPGADNARERIEGMKSVIAGSKVELIDVRGDDIDQTRAKRNVEDALAANPELVICDEPTSALDQLVAEEILKLLKRLQDELGLSYLFITHDLGIVRRIAHRTAVMLRGEVVTEGPTKRIFAPPFHPYTEKLISSVPEMRTDWLDEVLAKRKVV